MKKEYITCDKCCYDILDSEGEVMEHECLSPELKVKGVRYFETRRGLGYECKTNFKGVSIWNDGHGGQTYLNFDLRDESFNPKDYEELSEGSLEELINDYEYKKQLNENKSK